MEIITTIPIPAIVTASDLDWNKLLPEDGESNFGSTIAFGRKDIKYIVVSHYTESLCGYDAQSHQGAIDLMDCYDIIANNINEYDATEHHIYRA
jgi:hypothetical protein